MVALTSLLLWLLAFIGEAKCDEETYSGQIDSRFLRATVRIQTSAQTGGTGFLVSSEIAEGKRVYFLVTNKHLVGEYSLGSGEVDRYYDYLEVFFYKSQAGAVAPIRVWLKDGSGELNTRKVVPYPKAHIDIAVVSVAEDMARVDDIDRMAFDISFIRPVSELKGLSVGAGDLVFVLGYPFGIYSSTNYYPIAKSGFISSGIGEELVVRFPVREKSGGSIDRELRGKLILLDGTLVNGNSGGPVILPAGRRERIAEQGGVERTQGVIPNLVVGVQSQSVVEAGISVAFSSEYVLELINGALGKATFVDEKDLIR